MSSRRTGLAAGAAVLVLAAIAGAVRLALPAQEPEYEGKRLGRWLDGYDTPVHGAEYERTDEAVRRMGTNAFPALLRMVAETDAPWKLKLLAVAARQPLFKIRVVTAAKRNRTGALAFQALGRDARSTVPDLIRIYQHHRSATSTTAAAQSLGSIGPAASAAVPALVGGLSDLDPALRLEAVNALGAIHSSRELAVPALVRCLGDPDRNVAYGAAWSLIPFGADAQPAVPSLLHALDWSRDAGSRRAIIEALGQIHLQPELVIPALIKELDGPADLRSSAAWALGCFGNTARQSVPALVRSSNDRDGAVRSAARRALDQIDPQTVSPGRPR